MATGLERWYKATDQIEVVSNNNGGATLLLRRGDELAGVPSMSWPLDAAHTKHLIALLQIACKQPD